MNICTVDPDALAKPCNTNKAKNSKADSESTHRDACTHAHTQMWTHTHSVNTHWAKHTRPHTQTLVAIQKYVISCLEDVKAQAGFVTFVVTVRRVSPSLEKMINFSYLHYCPEGSSIGLTHLSFPLHCFSNGNEIECAASWVLLTETLLSREGAGEKNCFCS